MFDSVGAEKVEPLVLFTDTYKVRGTLRTRRRRLTDVLNDDESRFLVLEDVTFEELGSGTTVHRAPYAQVNLSTVLFGVSSEEIEPMPEMRTLKVPQQALISLPPFTIRGHIHLSPEPDLRTALALLNAPFVPVTRAFYWSDYLDEARTEAAMVAFNHAHAQILAPYEGEADVWQGLEGANKPVDGNGSTATAATSDVWAGIDTPRAPEPATNGGDVWAGLDGPRVPEPNTLSERPVSVSDWPEADRPR